MKVLIIGVVLSLISTNVYAGDLIKVSENDFGTNFITKSSIKEGSGNQRSFEWKMVFNNNGAKKFTGKFGNAKIKPKYYMKSFGYINCDKKTSMMVLSAICKPDGSEISTSRLEEDFTKIEPGSTIESISKIVCN